MLRILVRLILTFVWVVSHGTNWAGGASVVDSASQPAPVAGTEIVRFLNGTIDWYHRVESVDPASENSEELVRRANVRDDARQATRLGLAFARAEAGMIENAAGAVARVA